VTQSRPDDTQAAARSAGLARLVDRVVECRACPRLVEWREEAALRRPTRTGDTAYWSRPLPGFGDPAASLLVVGLAPAAHGGNRTGRMFTGDRSGEFLFGALHRAGYANQPHSVSADDGLTLSGAYVTAAVRCAPPGNKPTPVERDACAGYLATELGLLSNARVVLALGAFALDALWRQPAMSVGRESGRPRFAHGLEHAVGEGRTLLCSYHPSQRNVFTGLLTREMFDAVLARAGELGAHPG
jgi:uracil-DNA glycosylase family 4